MNNCSKCNLCTTVMNQVTLSGNCTPEECELLIVTDYSHAEDDRSGCALSGSDYTFMWETLNEIGVKFLVTALVKCLPVDSSTRRYRKPTEEEYSICKDNLVSEIMQCKPDAILLLGQATVDNLYPGYKVVDLRETPIYLEGELDTRVLATYHPNYVLNGDNEIMFKRFTEDLVHSCRYAMRNRPDNLLYKTVTINADQFRRITDIWCNDPNIEYVSFDTESNGLDPLVPGAKITSFSVCVDGVTGYNIFMYHPEHPNISDLDRSSIIESAKKLLTTKKVVVQHAKHEHRFVKVCWGFTPNIVHDTMYMAYILFMDYPGFSYGLKYLAGRFTGMPPWEEDTARYSNLFKRMSKQKYFDEGKLNSFLEEYKTLNLTEDDLNRFWEILNDPNYYIKKETSDDDVFYWMIPSRSLEKYAGMDAIAPLKLMKVLLPIVESDSGFNRCYKLLIDAAEAFANIELKGLRVHDIDLWTERYQEEIDKALDVIRSYTEVMEFEFEKGEDYNPNSSNHNAVVFFEKFRFPVIELTGKGMPSTNEGVLVKLISDHQKLENPTEDEMNKLNFLLNFRRYKKLKKIMSSYFIGLRRFISHNNAYDGVKCQYLPVPEGTYDMHMHPQYTLHGTMTGRLSSQNPSLHTLPTSSEVKAVMVPHYLKRGGLFVMADYGSCELRVLGSIAEKFYGDPHLADSFRRGEDAHKFVASKVYNKPIEEVTSLERRFSKSISFAVVYGSAISSVAETTGISIEEAENLFDQFYTMFPGVKKYIESMHSYVTQNACVRTPMGRIRHLHGIKSGNRSEQSSALRKSQNSPIQSSASDCSVFAIVSFYKEVERLGLDSKIVGTVHDSIYVDVTPGELFQSLDLLNYSMKTKPEQELDFLTCPLGVDLEISTNLNDHVSLIDMVDNGDGSRTFTLEGYDYVMNNVFEEMEFSYTLDKELIEEYEYDTGSVDITLDKGVLSLTTRGKFNMQKYKVKLTPKI